MSIFKKNIIQNLINFDFKLDIAYPQIKEILHFEMFKNVVLWSMTMHHHVIPKFRLFHTISNTCFWDKIMFFKFSKYFYIFQIFKNVTLWSLINLLMQKFCQLCSISNRSWDKWKFMVFLNFANFQNRSKMLYSHHWQSMWSKNFALSLIVSERSANLCFLKFDFISMAAILNYRENLIAAVESSNVYIIIY